MNALDSPLEALAFNYVNLGILAVVNNLWTWIAVVTAAISFWRIRTTGGAPPCSVKSDPLLASVGRIGSKVGQELAKLDDSADDREPQENPVSVEETAAPVGKTAAWSPLLCNDGVTKGKFTTYYDDVDGESDDGELAAVIDGYVMAFSDGGDEKFGGRGNWWERVVVRRNRDDGWYRRVDLTVINGNVVRLWDGSGLSYGASYAVSVRRVV